MRISRRYWRGIFQSCHTPKFNEFLASGGTDRMAQSYRTAGDGDGGVAPSPDGWVSGIASICSSARVA